MTVITTSPAVEYVEEYLNGLSNRFADTEILVTGYQVIGQDLKFPANVRQLNYIKDIKDFLEELEAVPLEK
jgi:hypothetical protein